MKGQPRVVPPQDEWPGITNQMSSMLVMMNEEEWPCEEAAHARAR